MRCATSEGDVAAPDRLLQQRCEDVSVGAREGTRCAYVISLRDGGKSLVKQPEEIVSWVLHVRMKKEVALFT